MLDQNVPGPALLAVLAYKVERFVSAVTYPSQLPGRKRGTECLGTQSVCGSRDVHADSETSKQEIICLAVDTNNQATTKLAFHSDETS